MRLRSCLHSSNRFMASAFSDTCSCSLFINCKAFTRLVDAIEEPAIVRDMFSFSVSRLNGLCFFLLDFLWLSFSFLDFLPRKPEDCDVLAKLTGGRVATVDDLELLGEVTGAALGHLSSSSSSPLNGSCSVSRRTFDCCCVTGCFRLGSCCNLESIHVQCGNFVSDTWLIRCFAISNVRLRLER